MTRRQFRVRAACLVGICAMWIALGATMAKDPKAELQKALDDFLIEGDWNYDDIDGALLKAARENKPVLVVFR